ncbi:carboxypeptidase-like regulatory domain-containing protein [Neobacillus endophyticus]|uniref:carboxypeptidase-like regulatory domain-containing protein n=1 Tax=Neobacillus endophyticus TaxID=2738405 RepID=UPI001C280E74|nr:carboxypeptidase-like regulatory domain-containing protein [Neobacillus endophyticus]
MSAILSAKVTTTFDENGKPIAYARIIVINSLGKIIGTDLTNSEGLVKIPVKVQKDPRFPLGNIGEVTIIAVANGFNEYINFGVPINEINDNTGRIVIPLWRIDPNRRNEPQFLNGSFHRFTVFKMLDYYAEKIGLKRQELTFDIGKEPPWSPKLEN